LGCRDIGIRISEFVSKTQFLWRWNSFKKTYQVAVRNLSNKKVSVNFYSLLISILVTALTEDISETVNYSSRWRIFNVKIAVKKLRTTFKNIKIHVNLFLFLCKLKRKKLTKVTVILKRINFFSFINRWNNGYFRSLIISKLMGFDTSLIYKNLPFVNGTMFC